MNHSPLWVVLSLSISMAAQKPLPPLKDGTVVDDGAAYRHEGRLTIEGRVKLRNIDLDLRGPVVIAPGADLDIENVRIQVSDPPETANGTSGLRTEGPARITIRNSKMSVTGSAHPIWWLQGNLTVDNFQTVNSEFHLDHAHATLTNFDIFELEISNASQVVGEHLRLVFLSTHTGEDERLEFSDIPSNQQFSRTLELGSGARAELKDTSAQMFLLYVHGRSDVTLSRIGRTQLAIFPTCHGSLNLPHGNVGSETSALVIPDPKKSDCPFRFRLSAVNVDTWDVYAGEGADLTFSDGVIDELTANGHAKLTVRNSEVYADWLSVTGSASLKVEHSTVGAQRLADERPDLATSQVRLGGHSQASFDRVKFDCGVVAAGDSSLVIRDSAVPPRYIRQTEQARVRTEPPLPIETGKEH